MAQEGCSGGGELAKTRQSMYRADYQDGGDDGDVDDNTEGYNDGKADDARKCIGEISRGGSVQPRLAQVYL